MSETKAIHAKKAKKYGIDESGHKIVAVVSAKQSLLSNNVTGLGFWNEDDSCQRFGREMEETWQYT